MTPGQKYDAINASQNTGFDPSMAVGPNTNGANGDPGGGGNESHGGYGQSAASPYNGFNGEITVADPSNPAHIVIVTATNGAYTNPFTGQRQTAQPVILDLDGNGISVTPQSSSAVFYDMAGDGKQHQTAWAGAGDGVLVLDINNNGVINQQNQVDFTTWDPTAETDMEALKDIFDTNHDGALDSGDTDWSEFKVMVTNADGTTTLSTLASLGITSINLRSNNQEIDLPDGSSITGETTYTKTGGGTGIVGDAVLNYDANGYVVTRTVTVNADGSTTIDNKAANTDGSLASETVLTTSADGNTRTLTFDDDGDGVVDRKQTIVKVVNGDGSITETLSNYDATGTILTSRQVTGTSTDGKTITVSRDFTGSGSYDQVETDVTTVGGALTVTLTDKNRDGSTHDVTITTTSADGLSKTSQVELTGSGVINATETTSISVDGSGTRTETVKDYAGSGTSGTNLVGQTVTVTSADGSTRSVTNDLDGNGTTDLTTSSTVTHNGDGSTTVVQSDYNGDSSLRDKTTTLTSADGYTKTTQVDANGDATLDSTIIDATVVNGDGSRTETVTTKSGNGTVLSKTVTTWSADGKTRTINIDADGDTHNDSIETVALVSGNSVDTLSTYSPNGATLVSKAVTTTSADGLTVTSQVDVNGDGTFDETQTSTTVVNVDHSSTVTVVSKNGAGTVQIGKTVTATSADGLTTTSLTYLDAQTNPFEKTVDAKVLNGDGSVTETVTSYAGTSLVQIGKTITITSADRRTITSSAYIDANASPASVSATVTNLDGSKTQTLSSYSPNGATLIEKVTTTTSADGLTITAVTDANGDAATDATSVVATTLNTDGSTIKTATAYRGAGTASSNEASRSVTTTSGNQLSRTTQVDHDGDGVFDEKTTDVTVLNSDGSQTETVSDFNGDGTIALGKTVVTISDDQLSKTTSTYLDGHTTADHVTTDVTVLNVDGSTVETVTDKASNGSVVDKSVITTTGNGLSVTVATDLDGNGNNDVVVATSTNTDDSVSTVTSTYSTAGVLASKSTKTVSASGLSTTIATDLDGNGTTDLSKTDVFVINSDGSKTETISDFTGTSTLKDKTVITTSADGLSITTQWDDAGVGTFTRSQTEVTTINADGSRSDVVSNLNGNGSLHDKTATATSADGLTVTQTVDLNGDGTVDQTVVRVVNADGSTLTSAMDGTVLSASGRSYGSTNGRYETDSATGLSKTIQYDANGDSLAESQTTDVTVLNSDGSRTETYTDSNLSGGTAGSANPVYTVTTKDKEVITTSANGQNKTLQWDLTGSGTFGESETETTAFNSDGSETETISLFTGSTLSSRRQVITSADGLTTTTNLDATGTGAFTQTLVDVKVLNADGTQTETVTVTRPVGGLAAKTVETTSADGRSVTLQKDPTGTGGFTASVTDATTTLADGSTIETLSDYNGTGTLLDKTTTTTSGDGRTVTALIDANGDGVNDQKQVTTDYVDGSSSTVTTDLTSGGGTADQATASTSFNGLVTTTQYDLNGNGVIDRSTTGTLVRNADGSSVETVQTYQTSHLVSGVETTMSPVLLRTTTTKVSADAKTTTVAVDVDGNGTTDQTVTTVSKIDGSMVTTVANNSTAKAVAPAAGNVLWNSAVATSNKTVASASTTTVSADGLTETVSSDYEGNGTYEHSETWRTLLDGSAVGSITDVNASSVVVARGYETISADGLTTTLDEDTAANGQINRVDTSTTRADGSKVETLTTLNSDGSLAQRVVTKVSANGQTVTPVTTTGPGTPLTVSSSNITQNDYNTDGTVTVSGATDTIAVGGAVNKIVLNGNNNSVNESNSEIVTISGSGTNKSLHVFGVNDIATLSSGYVELEDNASLTLSGSSDTIELFDSTSLTLWSGSGETVYVNGVGASANISSASLQLWSGASLTLTGSSDTIQMSDNTNLDLWSGTGETVYVAGVGATATLSSASIQLWDYSSLTLTGSSESIGMYNHATLNVTGSGNFIDVIGVGDTLTASSASIHIEDGNSVNLTGTSDAILMWNSSSVTASSNTDTVEVAGTGGTVAITGGGHTTLDWGAGATVANNGNTISMDHGVSVTATGNNDSFVFTNTNLGHETITGYVASGAGADQITVSHFDFADWTHLLAASTQSGSDVIITEDASDTILLKNTTLASLQQTQFHFA